MNDTIGVIGLGTMGIGIAGHLLDEGCTVKGYDINPERLRILAEKGGIPASSPSQTAKDCSALVLMVFNGEQVMNVLFGENGAAESLKPGSCVIICASVGAPACEQAAEKLEHMGIHLVDSPVRGTALSCETGTLYLMVGASDEAFTAAKGVLDTIGSCVVRAGHKAGMGQKAKTCMQAFSVSRSSLLTKCWLWVQPWAWTLPLFTAFWTIQAPPATFSGPRHGM